MSSVPTILKAISTKRVSWIVTATGKCHSYSYLIVLIPMGYTISYFRYLNLLVAAGAVLIMISSQSFIQGMSRQGEVSYVST